jgi:hypothetical protein
MTMLYTDRMNQLATFLVLAYFAVVMAAVAAVPAMLVFGTGYGTTFLHSLAGSLALILWSSRPIPEAVDA